MMSTWPDMKMGSKPLGPPISSSNCFTGRYSPTYRVPEHQMKRCPTNTVIIQSWASVGWWWVKVNCDKL